MPLILFLLSVLSFAHADESKIPPDFYLVNGCQVFNFKGEKVRVFPGNQCLFLLNGNFITSSDTSLRMIKPNLEIAWEIKGHFHHQLRFGNNFKSFLALSSDTTMKGTEPYRVDRFLHIETETGKIIASARADELLKGKVEFADLQVSSQVANLINVKREISHFNSISLVPKLVAPSKLPYIKEGNIVVNSLELGTCILNPEMTEVLYCRTFPQSQFHSVHDVTVIPKGGLMYFNNRTVTKTGGLSSSVQIIEPDTMKMIYEWSATPRETFFSPMCGSVQLFGKDHLVISHVTAGIFIVERRTKKIVKYIPQTNVDVERVIPSQEVKVAYLGNFLSFWD